MSSLRLNTGFCARNTLPMNPVRSYPVLRFTNAFSIKVDNLAADGSAFLYLNFMRSISGLPTITRHRQTSG
jgi:hypothetical protein